MELMDLMDRQMDEILNNMQNGREEEVLSSHRPKPEPEPELSPQRHRSPATSPTRRSFGTTSPVRRIEANPQGNAAQSLPLVPSLPSATFQIDTSFVRRSNDNGAGIGSMFQLEPPMLEPELSDVIPREASPLWPRAHGSTDHVEDFVNSNAEHRDEIVSETEPEPDIEDNIEEESMRRVQWL